MSTMAWMFAEFFLRKSLCISAALTLLIALAVVCLAAGQSSDELLKQLKDPEARIRWIAAEKLGRKRIKAAIPALGELLKDKDVPVRRRCPYWSLYREAVIQNIACCTTASRYSGEGMATLDPGALSTATLGFECATSSR